MGTPTPATLAPRSGSEVSRASGGRKRGGCSDEINVRGGDESLQEKRHVTPDETDMTSHNPRIPVTSSSTFSNTTTVAAAAAVSQGTRRKTLRNSAAGVRRKSLCPGLYCNSRGEGFEERELQMESTGRTSAAKPRSSGDRCGNAEAAAGEEVATAEGAQIGGTPMQDELIPSSGPMQDMTVVAGDGRNPGTCKGPMFQLPLKVGLIR